MADRFSREWVTTLTDNADKAAKSQSVKDLRELKTAITRELNSMKSYKRYVEREYGKAGLEEASAEMQFIRKAQKQLLDVRNQIENKIKNPSQHRVQYFKILNLAGEAQTKFETSFKKVEEEQERTGKPAKSRRQAIREYTENNVDKIFIDMFHKTKRSDFRAIGQALQAADRALVSEGLYFNVTSAVKQYMTDK